MGMTDLLIAVSYPLELLGVAGIALGLYGLVMWSGRS